MKRSAHFTWRGTAHLSHGAVGILKRNPRFVIVGTGRCGTNTAALSLRRAGVRCGHEEVFTPSGRRWDPRFEGDASWLAVPHLADFRGEILHLVRHPIDTVQSFLDICFFEEWKVTPFTQFARRYLPLTGVPVDDAFRWYLEWNLRCERYTARRYRLQDLDQLVNEVCRQIGKTPATSTGGEPIHANEKSEFKRRRHVASVSNILDPAIREGIVAMSDRYGFPLSEESGKADGIA